MPTRVEEILKKIHVLFAKGEAYQNSPDMIILSKSEMFALLEELNEAMYEVLDQYEATTRAKELAKLETEREASEIIAESKRDAEQIHAASLVYTDTMLDEVTNVINETKESIRQQYLEMLAKMDDELEALKVNRDGVKDNLAELHESERYINMLDEVRKARDEKQSMSELASQAAKGLVSPKSASKISSSDSKKASDKKESDEEWPEQEKAPAPVIRVNRPGENSGVTITNKHNRNKKHKKGQAPANTETKTMSEEELSNLSDEERAALEQSTPQFGQGYNAEDFNLDAEWEQFKEQNEEQTAEEPAKKGFFSRFSKKSK